MLPWEWWELHSGAQAGQAGSDKRARKALAGGLSSPPYTQMLKVDQVSPEE